MPRPKKPTVIEGVPVSDDSLAFWVELQLALESVGGLVQTASRAGVDVKEALTTLLMEIYITAYAHGAHKASEAPAGRRLRRKPGWNPGVELGAALQTFAAAVDKDSQERLIDVLALGSTNDTAKAILRKALQRKRPS